MGTQNFSDILTHIVISPLILASVFGNILIIIVKLHRKKLRIFNSGDLLIINLAICDINKTWILHIVWIYSYVIARRWNFDELSCIILQRSVVILFSVTSITLLVLTIERYLLIVKPFNRSFTLRRTIVGLVLAWLLIIALTDIPGFTVFRLVTINGAPKCVPTDHRTAWMNIFEVCYFIAFIFIPLVVIFILSRRAAKRLHKSTKSCCSQVKVSRKFNEKMRRNKSAINMLRSITLGSIMCYVPWAVSYLLQTHQRDFLNKYVDGTMFQPLFAWMVFGGFCSAPLTYSFFSKEFRKEVKRVFRMKRKSILGITTRITPK